MLLLIWDFFSRKSENNQGTNREIGRIHCRLGMDICERRVSISCLSQFQHNAERALLKTCSTSALLVKAMLLLDITQKYQGK